MRSSSNKSWPTGGTRSERTPVQPGSPPGGARLSDVREESGAVWVRFDSGHEFELAPGSVPPGLPAAGEVVPAEVVAEVVLAAERKIVARRVFAMLDRRLQPVARVCDKLIDRGHSRAAVEGVLSQMQEQGLYSDRQYAEAFCRDSLLSRAVGRRYLVQKLREKRVSTEVARAVAAEILDRETEVELASRAAAKRWERLRGTADLKAEAKVVRFLMGRGFDAGLANRAARETQPARDPGDGEMP